ncbi:syntaxin-binding protein 4 isoform X2 [Emydura macquarii macquarii]|uniref:syntaxin-binding protein 4 isoform X2 n=1 Tax=Emydura macquarii macquarii TaxID=1129001 RepID=UPI00352AE389
MTSTDSLHLQKRTIMGPYGINRAVRRITFSDCRNGLGVKIIGGYREQTEEDYGIFIKKILPGGMAATDSRLLTGDLILDVNGETLVGVTNERKEFLDLMDKYGSCSNTGSARCSPTQLLAGKPVDSLSSGSSSRSQSPQLLSPKDIVISYNGNNSVTTTPPQLSNDSVFQIITVSKGTGIGLNIVGGINRNEGPLVYIQEVIPGGDCHKDGRLKPGDQLVSVNKESMIGVSYEEAKSIINRTKLRPESAWEIAFIRQRIFPNYSENPQNPCSLLTSSTGRGQQQTLLALNLLSLPNENPARKVSTPNPMKTGFKKREQSPITSADSSPADVSAPAVASNWTDDYGPQERKISLNPTVRLRAEKLEMALNYLGIQPTDEQQQVLRHQLQKDSKGTVSFGDFVQVARNLFCLQLEEAGGGQRPITFGASEIASLLDSQLVSCDSLEMDDVERLKRERNETLIEISKLKEELSESVDLQKQLREELQTVKQEAKAAVEEARALRSRIHLAEAAQWQARGMEMDYEEIIRLLEAEITELKAQLTDHSGQNKDSVQDLRKRITVLDCQLRKSESARKTFEVATEKLLRFVEVVHDVLSDNSLSLSTLSDRRATLSTKSLLAQLGRNGRTVTAALAAEAKGLTKSVRAILEVDCLPYGWEEAYTADGIKYFINHVTQTTSWIHPVTSALSLSCSEEDEEDRTRELPDTKS